MSFVNVNLSALATDANYFSTLHATNITEPAISLLSYHDDFRRVLGPGARGRKIADLDWEAFHEAGVYHKAGNALYITSNYQDLSDNINITVLSLDDYSVTSTQFPRLSEANGATAYYPPGADPDAGPPPEQVYCDQGDFEHYSQLLAVNVAANTSRPLLTSFMGRNFSAINDVRQHPRTGDLWFTDATYGHVQHFRPAPVIPRQVYRFEPATGAVQAVADGFVQPNGLEFSPDLRTLYVSDTGSSGFVTDPKLPATIYAYDVVVVGGGGKRLQNRRVFAYTDVGFPDGVHCDTEGNVWVAAGDGVHVYSPEGALLGKVFVGEESNNFAFAPGKLFVFANARLYVVENLAAQGREVCREYREGCREEERSGEDAQTTK